METKNSILKFLTFFSHVALGVESTKSYEDAIIFTVFSKIHPTGVHSPFDDDLSRHGCVPGGEISMLVHGWKENITAPWVNEMAQNFLSLRGNCVFFMDYSKFSSRGYFDLTPHFSAISAVLRKKVASLGSPTRIQMFGFSFGARLVVDAGIEVSGKGEKIDRIYACDPAGPGFFHYRKDPKTAASFVQCINTSKDKGTSIYNCHQNWRLGNCGHSQVGAGNPPLGSHGLCPFIFNESFKHDFFAKNLNRCNSRRIAKNLPNDYKLGPREDRTSFSGDIFAATAKRSPWNVVNDVIDN